MRAALDRHHVVTAFVRREPPDLGASPPFRTVMGDVRDPRAVESAVGGQDAIFWTIGPRARESTAHLCSEGGKNVLWAMERSGVKRLVCESALGVGDSRGSGPFTRLLRVIRRAEILDKERQEGRIRASSIDWVIVRPTILTNGPRTGSCRVGTDLRVGWFPRISRADVADFMLDQLEDRTYLRQAVGITG